MTFGKCLYTLILMPLQLLFEVVYSYAYRFLNHPGLAIIALSLAINFLVLPLYRRADAIQKEQRDIENRLHNGVAHIRKTFHGDERTMMLQTYYRQNSYSPFYSLRSATSLILQIPFFIAAYRFLSGLDMLTGVSFGPIADLSQADALVVVGGFSINLLPILMTVINLISCTIFTKGHTAKEKAQLYVMAAFFLVFLYDSPAGLVFYWTLNNAFSLVKTIFYKLKNPRLILSIMACVVGVGLFAYLGVKIHSLSLKWIVFLVSAGIAFCLPLIWYYLRKNGKLSFAIIERTPDKKAFLAGTVFLAILTGVLIPSAVISDSPQEFIDINYFVHPLWYIVSALLIAIGTFVLWLGVFYWLASPKAKVLFNWGIWIACGVATVNYLFFGKDLGNLSANLKYDNGIVFTRWEQVINLLIITAVAGVFFMLIYKKPLLTKRVMIVAILTICCMSVINIFNIRKSIEQVDFESATIDENTPYFTLNQTEENVVVIMLDRAMGEYIPYIFNERPELKKQFDGFTYYSNTVSFGGSTNFATPAFYGGYEYTPIELNKRSSESLESKQNEALKVMPVLFDDAGFDVTVFDPSYAGYQWVPDLSIYDDYPNIHAFITEGVFTSRVMKELLAANRQRNFFCYSTMKICPLVIEGTLYQNGGYHQLTSIYGSQTVTSPSTAYGISSAFENEYSTLENLSNMTYFTDNGKGSFLMMQNSTTHEPVLLQEPDYNLSYYVDNTEYDQNIEKFSLNEITLDMKTEIQRAHYQTNVAALQSIGKWLRFLKQMGVYDNTKIIIASDHGSGLKHTKALVKDELDIECFYPLLLVKDYNSTGFSSVDEFMTNADVATIATNDVIENPINPFTGNAINSSEKTLHEQFIISSSIWQTDINNGNQFLPADWYSVHDNIWDKSNWELVAEDAVLP